jgi:PCO_ADO
MPAPAAPPDSRRRFLRNVGLVALACAYAPLLRSQPKLASTAEVRTWLQQVEELSRRLRGETLDSREWQQHIDALNRATPLTEFLPALQFDRALQAMQREGQDPAKTFIRLRDIDGSLQAAAFAAAYFVFRKGQVITPHGHRGMVSAHAVVAGRLHVRTFDRLGTQDNALLLRPRLDQSAGPGFSAAISATTGNVHWFVAETDGAATLDVIVQDIAANGRGFKIDLVDPLAATLLPSGELRAPLIDWPASARRYQQAG